MAVAAGGVADSEQDPAMTSHPTPTGTDISARDDLLIPMAHMLGQLRSCGLADDTVIPVTKGFLEQILESGMRLFITVATFVSLFRFVCFICFQMFVYCSLSKKDYN